MSETPDSEILPAEQASPPPEKPPELPIPTSKRWIYFAIGFIGWFLINGITWGFLSGFFLRGKVNDYAFVGNALILPANIIILIILAVIRKTRWFAFGILAAWVVNLLISVIIGLFMNGLCLLPFFFDLRL